MSSHSVPYIILLEPLEVQRIRSTRTVHTTYRIMIYCDIKTIFIFLTTDYSYTQIRRFTIIYIIL